MTWFTRLIQFVLLLAFWLVLSDQHNLLFLGIGAASAALVTGATHELFMEAFGRDRPHARRLGHRFWRFAVYVLWLTWRILVASLQVAYFAIHPRPPLQPRILRFRSRLRRPLAQTILANSITLVPGTLTLSVDDGEYLVHALLPGAADDLVNAKMQNMIGAFFLEAPEPAPTVTWVEDGEVAR
jgi:multicomponent Na+:H+ antiporter subunit E